LESFCQLKKTFLSLSLLQGHNKPEHLSFEILLSFV
jgi:hypothetical protein